MSRVSVALLGGFQARLPSSLPVSLPARKAQALLAYLALRPGQAYSREKLATILWGEAGNEQAMSSLRQTLSTLRHALPATKPGSLLTEGTTVALNPAAVEVDVVAFEERVAEGTPEALEQAAALYRGDFLDGFAVKAAFFEEWLVAERERIRTLALAALTRLLAHQEKAVQTELAIQTAVRLLALDPLQEAVHRTLMRLYSRQGRRAGALRQYQICLGVLQQELGAEPESETKQLYRDLLRRDAATPPTPAGHARGTRRHRTASRLHPAVPTPETPLIGREAELARLRQAFEEVRQGRGRVALIVGEDGIGKSRLLLTLAADVANSGRLLLGRAYETEQILPFGPWVDAFRSGQVTAELELLSVLPAHSRAELARLLPEADMPGLPPSTHDARRLFESVWHFIEGLAAMAPVGLMLEDMHWADEMSLRLLAFVARRIREAPVLILVTAREEEFAGAPVLRHVLEELLREPHFLHIALSSLSHGDTVALVRALAGACLAGAAVARLAEEVWAVSEGNPFVVVEAVRAIQEGTASAGPTGVRLPERVREIIARRLERLHKQSRQLVLVAAVIGREFDFALLQRAAGLAEGDSAEGVEELVRRRVLHGVGERFEFTHDRIRAVAYAQLLPPRRKLFHRQVAEAIEALYPDNLELHTAALGLHYREAEVWPKALTYLRRAGAQAADRSAHRKAVAWFEQALEALANLPESRDSIEQAIDLRFDLRNALLQLGDLSRLLMRLREAEALAVRLDDQRRLGRVSSFMAVCFFQMGDHDGAIRFAERGLAIARACGDFGLEVQMNFRLGLAYHALGEYRRAIDILKRNVNLLTGARVSERYGMAGLPALLSRAWLISCLAEIGEFVDATTLAREGFAIADAIDQRWSLAWLCFHAGLLHLRKGDHPQAATLLKRGLEVCRLGEIGLLVPWFESALGYIDALSGRASEAQPRLEQAIDRLAAMGYSTWKPLLITWLAEVADAAGRIDDAIRHLSRARELAQVQKERGHEAWALRAMGEVISHRAPAEGEEADRYYSQAVALAQELGMRPLVAHCHLGLGELLRRAGRWELAKEHLAIATKLFWDMDTPLWLARVEAVLAS
jgi:DNA-binding SARP family transcriptional activator